MKTEVADITCIVNAHRESHLIHPTLRSVKRARDYADRFGLSIEVKVVLDNPDSETRDVVYTSLGEDGQVDEVMFCDLALSRNHGVEKANSKYIAFIDGDDLWCQNWLVDCYLLAAESKRKIVLHPHYNVYFGETHQHYFQHIDMEGDLYEAEYGYWANYWTALSFGLASIYKKFPYRRNDISAGFGYEDWTWNMEIIEHGVIHKVVPNTSHFIRRGKVQESLLDQTNRNQAIPKIYELYMRNAGNKNVNIKQVAGLNL